MFFQSLDDPATTVRAIVDAVKLEMRATVGALKTVRGGVPCSADVVVLGDARLAPSDSIAGVPTEEVGVVIGAVALVADGHAVNGQKLALPGDCNEGVARLDLLPVHIVEVKGALGGVDVVRQDLRNDLDESLVLCIAVHGVSGALGDALALQSFKVFVIPIEAGEDEADKPKVVRGIKLSRVVVWGVELEIAGEEVDDYRKNLLRHAREDVVHVVHSVVDALGESRLVVVCNPVAVMDGLVEGVLKSCVAVAVLAVLLKKGEGVAQKVVVGVVHMSHPISLCPLCFYIIIITCLKPAVKVNHPC